MQYLIANNGRYLGALSGTEEEIAAQIGEGNSTTMLPPPRATDYWNGTEWVEIGRPADWFFKFDYDTKSWIDSRDLAKTKKDKWEAIKLQRNRAEFGGFTYLGKKFDSDQISQVRIIAAAVLGLPNTWTLADDTTIDLDAVQLTDLGKALATHVNNTHARGRVARQMIEQAMTNDEVDAVVL